MKDTALIFSDMHFYNNPAKSYIRADGKHSWFARQLDLAEQIFYLASELDTSLVIHNGDLFHEKTRINVSLYNQVWDFFKNKRDEGFEIILNTGNHDMLSQKDSSLRPFSEIASVITEREFIYWGNTNFVFLPYGQVENNLQLPERDNGKHNVLFTHEDIAGLEYGPSDYESGAPIKPQIFGDWDIVFNGHIHKPQELGSKIVNIGSPMITDWGEVDEIKRVIVYEQGQWATHHMIGPLFTSFGAMSDKLKKKIEKNDTDYFRIDVDSEQLSDPIFEKYNVFPRVTKTKKRELRLQGTVSIQDEIDTYVDIVETQLDKDKLKYIGKGLHDETN